MAFATEGNSVKGPLLGQATEWFQLKDDSESFGEKVEESVLNASQFVLLIEV